MRTHVEQRQPYQAPHWQTTTPQPVQAQPLPLDQYQTSEAWLSHRSSHPVPNRKSKCHHLYIQSMLVSPNALNKTARLQTPRDQQLMQTGPGSLPP
jgi:hypothetical protein